MALQKDLVLATGVVANYHKVSNPEIKTSNGAANVNVKVFLNNQARIANKVECFNKTYKIPAGTFTSINLATTDPRDLVYNYLKTLPEYAGAIDV